MTGDRMLDGELAADLIGAVVAETSACTGDALQELALASFRAYGDLVALPEAPADGQPDPAAPVAVAGSGVLSVLGDDWSYHATTVDGVPAVIVLDVPRRHLRLEFGHVGPSTVDSALRGDLTKVVDGLKGAATGKVLGAIGSAPRPIRVVLTEDYLVVDDLTFDGAQTIDNRDLDDEVRHVIDEAGHALADLVVTEEDEDQLGLPGGLSAVPLPGGLSPVGDLPGGLSPAQLPGGYAPAPGGGAAGIGAAAGGGIATEAGALGAVTGIAGGMVGRAVAGHVRNALTGGGAAHDAPIDPNTVLPADQVVATPAPLYCAGCGRALGASTRFCPHCGTPVTTEETAVAPPSPVAGVVTEAAAPHPQVDVPTTAVPATPPESDPAPVVAPPARALPGTETTMIFAAAGVELDDPTPPAPAPDPAPAVSPPEPAPPVAPVVTQPAPAPVAPTPPAPWRCTHTVPSGGVWVWTTPDPTVSPTESLPAGVQLQFVEAQGSWWKMCGWNGWEGWVDGRLLVPAG